MMESRIIITEDKKIATGVWIPINSQEKCGPNLARTMAGESPLYPHVFSSVLSDDDRDTRGWDLQERHSA